MCLLYEYSFNTHKTPGEILGGAAENREEKLSGFARELFTGACGRLPEIDAILAASAENWRLHRIARVPLAVLRLAVYEMKYDEDVPVGVAVNEAVELSKKFGGDESPVFINGILGKIGKAE